MLLRNLGIRKPLLISWKWGTGKTKVLIDNAAMLYDRGKINGALIIAPKGVIGTWYNQELPNHLPTHIVSKTVLWQATINQKQQDKLDTYLNLGKIFIF